MAKTEALKEEEGGESGSTSVMGYLSCAHSNKLTGLTEDRKAGARTPKIGNDEKTRANFPNQGNTQEIVTREEGDVTRKCPRVNKQRCGFRKENCLGK